jgi:hypothetical protein
VAHLPLPLLVVAATDTMLLLPCNSSTVGIHSGQQPPLTPITLVLHASLAYSYPRCHRSTSSDKVCLQLQ